MSFLDPTTTTQGDDSTPAQDFRYERKFVVPELNARDIELRIKLHPALFSEVYSPRHVNNVYFDSKNADSYQANVDGAAERTKCRLRWYGDLFGSVQHPILEFKSKSGLVGTKRQLAITPFLWQSPTELAILVAKLEQSNLPEDVRLYLKAVEPALLNRYHRRYFQSRNRAFRITIDTDLFSRELMSHGSPLLATNLRRHRIVVLELKYDRSEESESGEIANHLGLRLAKNSKYAVGLEAEREF